MASDALVADTARQALRGPMATVDLSRRPVLFALAASWPRPGPATRREALIAASSACGGPTNPSRPLRVEAAGCASP